jgi:phosphoglycolate phosphatase-like HAD superfamily hydrolase
LFDIDGTLLTSARAGAAAMQITCAELYGVPDALAGISMSGKTDPIIFQEILVRNQLTGGEGAYEAFHQRYLEHLRRTLHEPHRPRRLMPGIPHLLDALAAEPDVILGLLTGNPAPAAKLKLEVFDIWHYFRVGAYGGSDAVERNDLVPIAQSRTRVELGHDIPAQRIFVIGDTPYDIACARAHHACAVAVATGSYTRDDLQAHRPDHCFDDLSDVPAMLRLLSHERPKAKGEAS